MTELAPILEKAKAYREKGNLEAAIAVLKDGLEEFDSEPEFLTQLGYCYLLNKDNENAALNFLKANDIYFTRGVMCLQQDKFSGGIENFKNAIKVKPDDYEAYNNLGWAQMGEERLDSAIESYNKAIEIKPNYATAYNNLGEALRASGDLDSAIKSLKKAIELKPDYSSAHSNLGVAFTEKGDLNAAITSYERALIINPDDFETNYNLGIAFAKNDNSDRALELYKKVIHIRPDFADAYKNVAEIFQARGDIEAALEHYKKAIQYNPDIDVYYNHQYSLGVMSFNKRDPDILQIFSNLLAKKTSVRPGLIVHSIISLLKFEPLLNQALSRNLEGTLELTLQKTFSDLVSIPVLVQVMGLCPIPDLELEFLFTKLRSFVLLRISEIKCTKEAIKFLSALALQCFTNEFIYNESAEELDALADLETKIKEKFSRNTQPNSLEILILASYKPLGKFSWVDSLLISNELIAVIERQIKEVKEEEEMRSSIPIFKGIHDKVSQEVQRQYEDNPFPRWKNTRLESHPFLVKTVVKSLNLRVSDSDAVNCKTPRILIAGCGTGQHAIQTASSYKNSAVLAVDLSLSSLAYAKRRTEELGIQNIEYMQADILNLHLLDRQFDLVESVGVLHHMSDPLAGWETLVGCLKEGGLMRIGLYSELARRNVAEIKREIKRLRINPNASEMKGFREKLLASDQPLHRVLHSISDFYSLSEFRDLLFHAQEHCFTIPQIQKELQGVGLIFCGLQQNRLIEEFKSANMELDALYDLEKWDEFEKNNPDAFVNMYDFWFQKIA